MRTPVSKSPTGASLTIKLGGWLEANATGWGVIAVPIVVGLVLVAACVKAWLT